VGETTTTLVAGKPPKVTPVAPVKLVPVMVTEAPPTVKPLPGLTPLTVGGDVGVGVGVGVAVGVGVGVGAGVGVGVGVGAKPVTMSYELFLVRVAPP
jgi:hypothetical protein